MKDVSNENKLLYNRLTNLISMIMIQVIMI